GFRHGLAHLGEQEDLGHLGEFEGWNVGTFGSSGRGGFPRSDISWGPRATTRTRSGRSRQPVVTMDPVGVPALATPGRRATNPSRQEAADPLWRKAGRTLPPGGHGGTALQ